MLNRGGSRNFNMVGLHVSIIAREVREKFRITPPPAVILGVV